MYFSMSKSHFNTLKDSDMTNFFLTYTVVFSDWLSPMEEKRWWFTSLFISLCIKYHMLMSILIITHHLLSDVFFVCNTQPTLSCRSFCMCDFGKAEKVKSQTEKESTVMWVTDLGGDWELERTQGSFNSVEQSHRLMLRNVYVISPGWNRLPKHRSLYNNSE